MKHGSKLSLEMGIMMDLQLNLDVMDFKEPENDNYKWRNSIIVDMVKK